MRIDSPENIFPYGDMTSLEESDFNKYKYDLYSFNQNNVNADSVFDLIQLDYIQGFNTFILVQKTVTVLGGTNNVIVENLKDYEI